MPTLVPHTDSRGTGIRISLPLDSDAFVGRGLLIESTDQTAIRGAGLTGHRVEVQGTVRGFDRGIWLGDGMATATGNNVVLGESANVSAGSSAVALAGGDLSLTNDGMIFARDFAVVIALGSTDPTARIVNRGDIFGGTAAIVASVTPGGGISLTNTGRIQAELIAYAPFSLASVIRETIVNRGQMIGDISTGAGNDRVDSAGGRIEGSVDLGTGDDSFSPGTGADSAIGGAGTDLLDFTALAGAVVSLVTAGGHSGSAAGDSYTGFEAIRGSASGADRLTGNSLANSLWGQGGDDILLGGSGNDTLDGGEGNDWLDGGSGADRMTGGAGNDRFVVDASADVVIEAAGGGTDTILTVLSLTLGEAVENAVLTTDSGGSLTGQAAANRLAGAAGADRLAGRGGRDTLEGGGGADTLEGGRGNDSLIGGGAADRLSGQAGADRLIGGGGRDTLAGGAGADTFVFASRAQGGDTITDFGGADRIEIRAAGFGGGLGAGALDPDQFIQRATNRAADADDRFIFRTTDRTLWFEADGQGGAAAWLVADLQPGAVLTAGDILLV